MTRRWTWIITVLSVVAAGTWTARSFHRASDVSVASAVVTRGPIVRAIVATGTLQPVSAVQVGAQISGTIDALYASQRGLSVPALRCCADRRHHRKFAGPAHGRNRADPCFRTQSDLAAVLQSRTVDQGQAHQHRLLRRSEK